MSNLDLARSVGLPYPAEGVRPLHLVELEEFHTRHAKDTWWARVALLTLVFGMLGLNLWMTQRNYEAMMADVDASRMAMSAMLEATATRLDAIEGRLGSIEGQGGKACAALTP